MSPGQVSRVEVAAGEFAGAPADAHFHGWDRLRVVASLDIIGSHLAGEHLFWGGGTPLFLILAIAFGVHRPRSGSASRVIHKRLQRVLLPWLAWSLVIAGILVGSSFVRGQPAFAWWRSEMWLYGPQIHLWFLPVAAVGGVLAHFAHRATQHIASTHVAAWAALLGLSALVLAPHVGRGWPFEQWSFSVPGLCFGFALGRLLSVLRAEEGRAELLGWASLVALAMLILSLLVPASAAIAFRYTVGGALLVLFLALPNFSDPVTTRMAPLMLGVYVLHPIVFSLLIEPALRFVGFAGQRGARIGLGFLATLGLVALLRRTPVRVIL